VFALSFKRSRARKKKNENFSSLNYSHQGRGVRGQRVALHLNGTAKPSAIKSSPTSRPAAFSVPHRRP
jgi:hypothetical protein